MKVFLLLIISLFAFLYADCQKHEDITAISLTRQTRGYFEEVVVSRDSVRSTVENHRMPEQSRHYSAAIDQDDWARLVMTLNDVPLDGIDGLQSPTTDRARDAAMHATIEISFKGGYSVSHSFDDGNPHPDLKPLLDVIDTFRMPDARK